MTQARFELNEYTTRVLDVFKGKHGLKNRQEALNKFFEEYGQELVEPEIKEKLIEELDKIIAEHKKKYGNKTMTMSELDKVLGL